MGVLQTEMPADAVTYYAALAVDWERRYQKRSFQARQAVLLKCLEGRDLAGGFWLDAGCGGTLSRWLAARGCRVLGVDAAAEMIIAATQLARSHGYSDRLKFARTDTIARLALDDSSLDGVVCSSVLEYVSDPSVCLAEFARVLKPRGLLLVSVPNRHSVVRSTQLACHRVGAFLATGWFKFLDYSCQQYSPREFGGLLRRAGFSMEKLFPFGSPLPGLAQRSHTWASLLMFVAHKSV
jgi:2-polyprenyl-6-hydroxyphenyl methylase/3-demethylubiquinone-9 3-methyltransferase